MQETLHLVGVILFIVFFFPLSDTDQRTSFVPFYPELPLFALLQQM